MSSQPRFGSNFEIRRENRLDALHPKKETPDYMTRSLEIRKLLQESAQETGGWPEMPSNFTSVEQMLEQAKEIVTLHWNSKIKTVINEKVTTWADELEGLEGMEDKIALLRDGEALEQKLMIHQFSLLEDIRPVLPEAWRELVLVASERQMAAVVIARHWFKEMSEKKKGEFAKQIGLKKPVELEIMLDAASMFGKFIDQAYVKQIELADAPGGKESTELKQMKKYGSEFVYDLYTTPDTNEIDVKSYAEVFPFEWERLAKGMDHLAEKTDRLLQQKKLGKEYRSLPDYLRKMKAAYGSCELDPEKLKQQWDDLLADMRTLALEGCPIMLVPQQNSSVAGKAEKVDVEMRLGFRTPEMQVLERKLEEFRQIGNTFLQELRPYFEKDHEVPPLIMNYQPFAYGPNVYWATRGEKDDTKIVAHTNAVLDVAIRTALPAFRKAFSNKLEEKDFCEATLFDNSLHEIGHAVAPRKDKKVSERIGGPGKAKIIEELKADTVNQKLILAHMEAGGKENYEMQLYAKLADVCDYLRNKPNSQGTSGEPYYYSGVGIIDCLLEKSLVVKRGEKYMVTDWKKAITAIAEVADEILELYTKGTPEKLDDYIASTRKKGEKKAVIDFIKQLKG